MDARSVARVAPLCSAILIVGCLQQAGSPTAQRSTIDSLPISGPDNVDGTGKTGEVQTVGDMEPVQRWIEQIERLDDLRSRVTRPMDDPEPSPSTESTYGQSPAVVEPMSERCSPDASDDLPGSSGDGATASSRPTIIDTSPDSAPASGMSDGTPIPELEMPSANAQSATPPALGRVTARAAETAPPGVLLSGDGPPTVNAPAFADHQLTLEEFAEQWLAQPIDTSFRAQLDRRVLLVLASKYEEARCPLEMASDEQKKMAGEFVEALIAIRDGHGGDPAGEANRALARVEALMESLVPLSDLRIPTLALTRAVRGFGCYETFDPPHFLAGRENELVVYCEIANFVSRPTEAGGYESQFSMRTAVLNRAGDVVIKISDDHIADECRTRRHDCFIPRLVRLPATLSPGEYVVKVTIIDKIAGKVAERRTTFRVIARS